MTQVDEARSNFEESWHELKGSFDKKAGLLSLPGSLPGVTRPGRGWIAGTVALAAGLALGLSLRKRYRRRSPRRPPRRVS